METDYARKQLTELLREGRPGNELAMEIAGLLASNFQGLDFTMGLYKNGTGLFYSTLPDDEAMFFSAATRAEEITARPGATSSQTIALIPGRDYDGYIVLEGEGAEIPIAAGERQFMEGCAFAIAYCLLAQQSEENYQLDPLTGLQGRPSFQRVLADKKGGYLLAACYDVGRSHTGYWTDEDEINFCQLAKKSQEIFGKSFRISDTVVAMVSENVDRAAIFAGLQELSDGPGNISAVFLPLTSLEPELVYRRLDECLAQCTDGKIHGPVRMPAKLPFWTVDGERTEV